MEPVFMILGQSAATAACLAIDDNVAVQNLDYAKLRERLLADGQILEVAYAPQGSGRRVDPARLKGIVVDDVEAKTTGAWEPSTSTGVFIGSGYRHEGDKRDGSSTARFELTVPESGRYEVRLGYTPHANRATRVKVTVVHADGSDTVAVNQQLSPPHDGMFQSLGTYRFTTDNPAVVTLSNDGADGYVIIDGLQFLPQ